MDILHDIIATLATPTGFILLFLMLLVIATKLSNFPSNSQNQEKSFKTNDFDNEKAKQDQQEPPQIVYIKQGQNGCVTFLIVIAATCIILYFLPRILERIGILYLLFNSTN